MMFDLDVMTLAQADTAPGGGETVAPSATTPGSTLTPEGQPEGGRKGGLGMLPMFVILGLFVMLMMTSGRKQKKKRAKLLASIDKGQTVTTIGGIKGVIVEMRDDEVTLKVDENANTRIRFTKSAIQTVVSDQQ